MDLALRHMVSFNQPVLRNIVRIEPASSFSELSDDPEDWQFAELVSSFRPAFSESELQYQAIDFIFEQWRWIPSRFSNGSFAAWYGSTELATTFDETIYHWKQFLNDTPELLAKSSEPYLYTQRSVFQAQCDSALVDLRPVVAELPEIIAPDDYSMTRSIAKKLHKDGFPGVVTFSARKKNAINLALLNSKPLSHPEHYADYQYTLATDDLSSVSVEPMSLAA